MKPEAEILHELRKITALLSDIKDEIEISGLAEACDAIRSLANQEGKKKTPRGGKATGTKSATSTGGRGLYRRQE